MPYLPVNNFSMPNFYANWGNMIGQTIRNLFAKPQMVTNVQSKPVVDAGNISTPTPQVEVSTEDKAKRLEEHKKVVADSVEVIKKQFESSGLSNHFKTQEDRELFFKCLDNIKFDENATGAGHVDDEGNIIIETNNEKVNSKAMMTKLLIHEANHAFLHNKANANNTLNFPTKAEEIECETLALTSVAQMVGKDGIEDYEIYDMNISEFKDAQTVQNADGFKNWLNGYSKLADNLQGDITVSHNAYVDDAPKKSIKIKSGDVIKAGGKSYVIGKDAFLEGDDKNTSVMQLIVHHKDHSTPDTIGKIIFDGMEPSAKECEMSDWSSSGRTMYPFQIVRDGQVITGKFYP